MKWFAFGRRKEARKPFSGGFTAHFNHEQFGLAAIDRGKRQDWAQLPHLALMIENNQGFVKAAEISVQEIASRFGVSRSIKLGMSSELKPFQRVPIRSAKSLKIKRQVFGHRLFGTPRGGSVCE
jgi:hypothetical protein